MKLPPQANLVFKGQIFDIYQWEQEMFDGSKATFEMLKRPNTIQILPTSGDNIFIIEEEQPSKGKYISPVGGRQDEGEDPVECAKRELLEETGMTTPDWELFAIDQPYNKLDWTIYTFIARDCKKIQEQNLDPGEKIRVYHVTFTQFIDMAIEGKISFGESMALNIARMKYQHQDLLEEFKKKLFRN